MGDRSKRRAAADKRYSLELHETIAFYPSGELMALRLTSLLAVTALAACASNSGVFRVDENKYQVATRATWELGGRAGAKRMALEEATRHCDAQKKRLRVLDSKERYGHFEGGTVEMTFTCD
jgi:hypothetical protein